MATGTYRIGIVSHRFQANDGQGRVNYEVVRAALDKGHHVTLLAMSCAKELAEHPNCRFLRFSNEKLPTAALRTLVFARASAQWIRKHRNELDFIQVNGFVTWERGDIAAAHFVHSIWRTNPYYPYKKLSLYDLYQRAWSNLNARWEKKVFRSAKLVISVSSRVRQELEQIGVESKRIEVINNGVDTKEFYPGPQDRAAFGLPEGVPIALFVGDIKTPRKNLGAVLQALRQIPRLHLAVGGALEGSPFPAMAKELGISERVHFWAKSSKLPRSCGALKCLCSPLVMTRSHL